MFVQSIYVCPHCLKTRKFDCYIEDIVGDDKNGKFYKPEYNAWCEDCEEWMFDCDPDMVDIVIALNKKGYKTEFSCAGHHKDFDDIHIAPHEICTIPYVSFRAPGEMDPYLRNMIDGDPEYKEWISFINTHTGDFDRRFSIYSGSRLMSDLDEKDEERSKEDWNKLKDVFFKFVEELIEKVENNPMTQKRNK